MGVRYDGGMPYKNAEVSLEAIKIPLIYPSCPNCKLGLKAIVFVGVGVCKPDTQYCDGCGWTKDISHHG